MRKLSFLKTGYIYFALIILIILGKTFYGNRGYSHSGCVSSVIDGEIIEYPNLNDSMPHYQYRRIEDSVNNARPKEIQHHKGDGWEAFGIHVGYFGANDQKYFAGSKSYYLNSPDCEFYEKNGKNYLRTVVWDKINNGRCSGHQEEKITPYKFIVDDKLAGNGYGMLLVPLNKTPGKVLNFILIGIVLLSLAAGLYVFFGICIHFLLAISRGKAFSQRNVSRLNNAGKYLLIIGMIPFILQSVFYLFTKSNLPAEVNFSFFRAFFEGSDSIVAGLIALLFASAFRRGWELQQDQELTV